MTSRSDDPIPIELDNRSTRPQLGDGSTEPQLDEKATPPAAPTTPKVVLSLPTEPENVHSRPPSPASVIDHEDHPQTEQWPLRNRRYSRVSDRSSEERLIGPEREQQQQQQQKATPPRTPSPTRHSTSSTTSARGEAKFITRNDRLRFLTGWIVHLPALATTIAFIFLGKTPMYWYSEEGVRGTSDDQDVKMDAETINNMLQLPAKVHELMIIASLSAIVLAMFRRRLIGGGVRLGFLTGGYRVGDLGYLRSPSFWRQGMDANRPWEVLLAGFLAFATIMSTVVGPASAVLIVPTLGWYRMDPPSEMKLPLFYFQQPSNVWPGELSEAKPPFINMTLCKSIEGSYQPWCPAGGFSEIWSWAQSFGASDLSDILKFQFPATELRRELVFTQSNKTTNGSFVTSSVSSSNSSTTLCTTPSHFLMVSLGLLRDYIGSFDADSHFRRAPYKLTTEAAKTPTFPEGQQLLQPFVQSKCWSTVKGNLSGLGNDTLRIPYPVEHLNCFNDTSCLNLQRRRPFVDGKDMYWFNDIDAESGSFSTNYLTMGNKSSILFLAGQLPNANDRPLFYACNFLASWIPSNYTINSNINDILNSLSHEECMQRTFEGEIHRHGKVMSFNKSFEEYISPSLNVSRDGRMVNATALSRVVNLFATVCDPASNAKERLYCVAPVDSSDKAATETFLAKVFGIYLTDVLSRTAARHEAFMDVTKDGAELTVLDLNKQFGSQARTRNYVTLNDTHMNETNSGRIIDTTVKRFTEEKGLATSLPISLAIERYGYGSGQPRKTLDFAVAMMGIYLGVVAVYAAVMGVQRILEFLAWERRGRPVTAANIIPWSDLQDLVILAFKSPPPRDGALAGSGAGVDSPEIWEKIVRARADAGLNVQLVLGESGGTRKLDDTGTTAYF